MRGKLFKYDSEKTRVALIIIVVIGAFVFKILRIARII